MECIFTFFFVFTPKVSLLFFFILLYFLLFIFYFFFFLPLFRDPLWVGLSLVPLITVICFSC